MSVGPDKKVLLARQLEDWINHIVKEKANGENEKIPIEVKQDFDRMIQANVAYHRDMASTASGHNTFSSIESYHKLMSDVYQRFLCEGK